MNFLKMFLGGIALVPGMVQGVEALFGAGTGPQKKEAALSVISSSINVAQAVINEDIVDEPKFSAGLGLIVDGVVGCFNASVWAKK